MIQELLKLSNISSKFCVGMEGNVSMKTSNGFCIKASGVRMSDATEDDFVEYDFNGKQLSNFNKVGSMEISFHKFLLSQEDINFVAHTHPVNVLKILCTDWDESFANRRLFPDQIVFNGCKSCLIPYTKPGEELSQYVESGYLDYLRINNTKPKIILLKNHGLITYGSTIEECIIKTEICEKSAEILYGALCIGKIVFLTDEETNHILDDKKEKYRYSLIK